EVPLRQLRAMRAIEICRTAALGGHVEECDQCGALRISYNSCRNRHCPKCQCLDRERWLKARQKDLLPTPYFHLVFTLPEGLRPLALRNQESIYQILFKAASGTLKELTEDPKYLGAEVGFIAIIHTWSQTLMDHPHLHCIVTGGGLSSDGKKWIPCKKNFFIPVKVLSRLFRGKFLAHLKEGRDKEDLSFPGNIAHLKEKGTFKAMLDHLYEQEWVVYCKPPFQDAETVMEYLGRYTHRVAITNNRLVSLQADQVTFRYRDRKQNDSIKLMTLHASEFIRRFLLHVLPDGFMKIRYYGILSNRNRHTKLLLCKRLFGLHCPQQEEEKESWQDLLARVTGIDPRTCLSCGKGKMVFKEVLDPSAFPLPP
ncbi:MAG TPA: IS91 family transposase, partial [Desulfobacterales bacterium]|nr:IS91 family transposase [Desulfobacterales bacterium]